MILDDELRRLFTDDRLDVPVHPGATEAVVSGARRRRRQRMAAMTTGSALAAAVIIAGGVALSGGSTPEPVVPADPPTTTVPKPPALGPTGLGGLKLGMKYEDAVAAGLLVADTPPPASPGCGAYDLPEHPNGENEVSVYARRDLGVAAIFLPPGVRTPEGISLGSPLVDFYAAYPSAGPGDWQAVVPVPGNPNAVYHMVVSEDGKVGSLALAIPDHGCFG